MQQTRLQIPSATECFSKCSSRLCSGKKLREVAVIEFDRKKSAHALSLKHIRRNAHCDRQCLPRYSSLSGSAVLASNLFRSTRERAWIRISWQRETTELNIDQPVLTQRVRFNHAVPAEKQPDRVLIPPMQASGTRYSRSRSSLARYTA